MKKIMGLFILIFSLICFANEKIIVVAYSDVESFPNAIGNGLEISDPPGVCVEIIKQAAEEIGYKVKFVRFPNKRVLIELESGIVDGAFLYSFNEERLLSGVYPMKDDKSDSHKRLTSQGYFIYKHKDSQLSWDGKKFENLDKSQYKAIGINLGYSVVNDLKKLGVEVEEVKTTEQNLEKLELKRIAGFVTETKDTVDYYIESGKYPNVVKLQIPFIIKDYFLLFSHEFMKNNEEDANKIWGKIEEIKKQNKLCRNILKY